jgi:hypothetical protein
MRPTLLPFWADTLWSQVLVLLAIMALSSLAARAGEKPWKIFTGESPIAHLRFGHGAMTETHLDFSGAWKKGIIATLFWVGEPERGADPGNRRSAWDSAWLTHFGGVDTPYRRNGYQPGDFRPRLNPFYVALPYCDMCDGHLKPESAKVVPWYDSAFQGSGRSVCHGKWIAIRYGSKTCYAQWEDVGPFRTDHWQYVFGHERPRPNRNGGAGIDISPAVRDYLGMSGNEVVDWKL